MNNENKKLLRIRKRRFDRRKKMNNDMNLLLNKIKSEKEKKIKDIKKIKELEILLVGNKNANNSYKLEGALRELYKMEVIDKNLHEIKQEILKN